jgi:hypothetical protein
VEVVEAGEEGEAEVGISADSILIFHILQFILFFIMITTLYIN